MVIARGSWGRSFRRQQWAGSLLASLKPTFAQVDTEVAALLAKRKALTAGLVVAGVWGGALTAAAVGWFLAGPTAIGLLGV